MIALTRLPSVNLQAGERTYVSLAAIDQALAERQHAAYCQALARCGAAVISLPAEPELPDSTFVEDTAIVLDEIALLCSMGAKARRLEPRLIEPVLREYRAIERIELPATIDGGDVLRVGQSLLVGRSSRTNDAAIGALGAIGARYGYDIIPIAVRGCLHLKTACTALPDGRLLVNRQWVDVDALRGFELISVPAAEPWGANILPIQGQIVLAAAHSQTAELVQRLGFPVHQVDISEFAKAEGGVTCLSLLVP
jgi:dimethylargininase